MLDVCIPICCRLSYNDTYSAPIYKWYIDRSVVLTVKQEFIYIIDHSNEFSG